MDIYVPFNESNKMQNLLNEIEDMFSWFFEDKKVPEYKLKSVYVEDGKVEQIYSTKYSGTYVRAIIQKETDCYKTIIELFYKDKHKSYIIQDWSLSYSKKPYLTASDEDSIDVFKNKVYEQLTIFNPYMKDSI